MTLDEMTPQQKAAVWNRLAEDGGAVIRWDAELGTFRTRDHETFDVADVEATVAGLLAAEE